MRKSAPIPVKGSNCAGSTTRATGAGGSRALQVRGPLLISDRYLPIRSLVGVGEHGRRHGEAGRLMQLSLFCYTAGPKASRPSAVGIVERIAQSRVKL
jgi:hypothetical protein